MKLEIERQSFLKAWQAAEKSASAKSPKEIISGILVKTGDNDTVTLEATDLKSSVKCKASGVRVLEGGAAVLSLTIFGNLLKRTTEETMTLEVNSERGLLIAGKSKIRFAIFNVDDFPKLPDSAESEPVCEITTADLVRLISEGSAASSQPQDFPKYLGTCLLRTGEGVIKAVSTDGKRLALSKMICTVNRDQDLMLPTPALRELGKMLASGNGEENVRISCNDSTAWFALPEIEYSIRLIDANFPNYERILNDETRTTLRISRDKLLPVLERVDVIARTTPSHIMALGLQAGGEMIITARAPDAGTAREFVEATIEGGDMQIGFNVGYFQDGLRALGSGDIVVEFSHEEGQCRMTRSESDDFLYMLMPARLSAQDFVSDEEISDFIITQPEGQEQEQQENNNPDENN